MSNPKADLILTNGRVFDAWLPESAVAIHRGRILAVDRPDRVLAEYASPETQVTDLAGSNVLPGFNDCHMHILGLGFTLLGADVRPEAGIRDVPTLIQTLTRWAAANPGSQWIRAYGYNQNSFPDARHVTAADLDKAFPDRPVVLFHASGHAAVANSAALRAAQIRPTTPDPANGQICRDGFGAPTGVLLESAVELVTKAIPALTREERTRAILLAAERLASMGITSASDMGIGGPHLEDDLAAYKAAIARGAPLRITLCPDAATLWNPSEIPAPEQLLAEWGLPFGGDADLVGCVRLGALKLYADGALTTRTAALEEPYADGSGNGMLLLEPEELNRYMAQGHRQGWQLAVHAIGDRAIEAVLQAYEELEYAGGWASRSHRIEHAMMVTEAMAVRMAALEVTAVLQPEFLMRLGDAYVLALGMDRARKLNRSGMLRDLGVRVAFSSDNPVVPGNPLDGIRAAVVRETPSGQHLGEDHWSVMDGIRAYTAAAAKTVRDTEVGFVLPSLRADLSIVSGLPEDSWRGLELRLRYGSGRRRGHAAEENQPHVQATIVGGKVVFGQLGQERVG